MRLNAKRAIATLIVCGFIPYQSSAQQQDQKSEHFTEAFKRKSGRKVTKAQTGVVSRPLSPDDGLAVIAAALDLRIHTNSGRDCSHLVHAIYDRAGFPYPYASSSDLYDGSNEFRRVTHPQVGDLAVWRGHLGIVVNPAQHTFYSALRSGLGIDSYDAPYWKERGQVRFYRYIKGSQKHLSDAR
jgi:cell wall-associated NlpC family hydrolase